MPAFGRAISPTTFYAPTPPFHKDVYSVLGDDTIKRACIVAPRRHSKTTCAAFVAPLHHLFYGKTETGRRVIVLSSKAQGHSIRSLGLIKHALEYSQTLRALYGYWGRFSAQKWRDDFIILKDGSGIYAIGTGQQILGFKVGDQRPSLFICDDLEDDKNTRTPESMDANYKWLMQEAEPSLSDTGKLVAIGTPMKQNCIVDRLSNSIMFAYQHYSAEVDRDKKQALWPERMSWKQLQDLRAELTQQGRFSYYASNYLCEIIGDEDQIFRPEYWQYYANEGFDIKHDRHYLYVDGEPRPVNVYLGVDPASSIDRRACYSVIMALAMDAEENVYVVDYWRNRVHPMQLADKIVEWNKRFKPKAVRVEAAGYQEMLRDYLKRQDERIPGLGSKLIPRESKTERFREGLQPLFAAKRVYVEKRMRDLIDEFEMFPNGKYSDTIDAFYYAAMRMRPPRHDVMDMNRVPEQKTTVKRKYNWKTL
jgi:predicted phage terminase large subunit-like protein|tara:strand:- start:12621 stop:14054 length:1434 start_codon:yes stop_codon:yes gene_type:complete